MTARMHDDVALTLDNGAVIYGTVKGRTVAAKQSHDPTKFGCKFDIQSGDVWHRNVDQRQVSLLSEPLEQEHVRHGDVVRQAGAGSPPSIRPGE